MAFIQKFYISDTHFGHARILELSKRPFRSIQEHDEVIVKRWNDVVRPDDWVYHLGDFALGIDANSHRVEALFKQLNGEKFLVIGNHDVDENGELNMNLARLTWAAKPTHMLTVNDGGQRVQLCHFALRTWRADWHFYGHSHGNLPAFEQSRDVGVDVPDVAFQPRTFAELTRQHGVNATDSRSSRK